MAAIVKDQYRIYNATQFKDALGGVDPDSLYLFVGRPQPWADDTNPDTPVDTVEADYEAYKDMIAMKKLLASDVTNLIVRRDWISGTVYDEYSSNMSADHPAYSGALTLFDSAFYVVTDEFNVYKCLFNNGNTASTIKPTGTSINTFQTSDGYIWKYMLTIPTGDVLKFVTEDFIPVKTIGSVDDGSFQYDVEQAAVDGAIDVIKVTAPGSGYTSATVAITGDGAGATATAVIQGGAITGITVTSRGTGYRFATVAITGDGSGATAEVIIGPNGGHGKNAVKELGGYYVGVHTRLEYDESGDFPTANDYRRIGLVLNPYNFGTSVIATASTLNAAKSVTYTSGVSGVFDADETLVGQTSGATAKVLSYIGLSRTAYYIQDKNTGFGKFQLGETVVGQTSGASGIISSLNNPEVQPDSGTILYTEQRRPIVRAPDQVETILLAIVY